MQAARRLHARRPRGGAPPGRRGDDARRRRGRCKSGFRFSPRRAGGIRADSAGPTGNPLPVTPPNRPRSDPTSWRPAEAPKAPNPRCKAVLRASAPPKKPGMVRKGSPVRVRQRASPIWRGFLTSRIIGSDDRGTPEEHRHPRPALTRAPRGADASTRRSLSRRKQQHEMRHGPIINRGRVAVAMRGASGGRLCQADRIGAGAAPAREREPIKEH